MGHPFDSGDGLRGALTAKVGTNEYTDDAQPRIAALEHLPVLGQRIAQVDDRPIRRAFQDAQLAATAEIRVFAAGQVDIKDVDRQVLAFRQLGAEL
ncbi:hypothetical protein LTR94_036421, partial [Friedmanniomyces endolithicus]